MVPARYLPPCAAWHRPPWAFMASLVRQGYLEVPGWRYVPAYHVGHSRLQRIAVSVDGAC